MLTIRSFFEELKDRYKTKISTFWISAVVSSDSQRFKYVWRNSDVTVPSCSSNQVKYEETEQFKKQPRFQIGECIDLTSYQITNCLDNKTTSRYQSHIFSSWRPPPTCRSLRFMVVRADLSLHLGIWRTPSTCTSLRCIVVRTDFSLYLGIWTTLSNCPRLRWIVVRADILLYLGISTTLSNCPSHRCIVVCADMLLYLGNSTTLSKCPSHRCIVVNADLLLYLGQWATLSNWPSLRCIVVRADMLL